MVFLEETNLLVIQPFVLLKETHSLRREITAEFLYEVSHLKLLIILSKNHCFYSNLFISSGTERVAYSTSKRNNKSLGVQSITTASKNVQNSVEQYNFYSLNSCITTIIRSYNMSLKVSLQTSLFCVWIACLTLTLSVRITADTVRRMLISVLVRAVY